MCALPATDDFAPSENPITTNWTTMTGYGDFEAVGGIAREASAGTPAAMYWDADAFNDNQYSKAVMGWTVLNYGVCVRMSPTAATLYDFPCQDDSNAKLYKCIAGSWTQLGADYVITMADGGTIQLSVSGTTLTPSVNGVDLATRTDASIASGSPGIRSGNADSQYDTWEGGNVSAAGQDYTESISGILGQTATLARRGRNNRLVQGDF
jgi:hypothetical protein